VDNKKGTPQLTKGHTEDNKERYTKKNKKVTPLILKRVHRYTTGKKKGTPRITEMRTPQIVQGYTADKLKRDTSRIIKWVYSREQKGSLQLTKVYTADNKERYSTDNKNVTPLIVKRVQRYTTDEKKATPRITKRVHRG